MGLRKVTNIEVAKCGVFSKHYEVRIPTEYGLLTGRMSQETFFATLEDQRSRPERLHSLKGTTWWWYQAEFYAEDDGYSAEEVKLLLWEAEQERERRFERLRREMAAGSGVEEARREVIPEDVRIFVWKRDGGKCVKCGSQETLEFDHIIPVSKGGSNTARNIQLLCETCNRRKSDSL